MSYSNPTSWTDVDAGGNAISWGTRVNKLIYPAYEMLRLALYERWQVVNQLNNYEFVWPTLLANRVGNSVNPGFFESFDTLLLDSLLPSFANHTINGGDFTSYQYDAVAWTLAAMETAIGETIIDRGDAGQHAPYSAQWSKQRYEILDRLRWVYGNGYGWDESAANSRDSGTQSSWADALTAFAAAEWIALTPYAGVSVYSYRNGSTYYTSRWKSTVEFTASPAKNCSVDLYMTSRALSSAFSDDYEDPDYSTDAVGDLMLVNSDPTVTSSFSGDWYTAGAFDTAPRANAPGDGESYGFQADTHYLSGSANRTLRPVYKFDQGGGFAFLTT